VRLPASIDPRLISPIRQDLETARQEVLTGIANTDAACCRRELASSKNRDRHLALTFLTPTRSQRMSQTPALLSAAVAVDTAVLHMAYAPAPPRSDRRCDLPRNVSFVTLRWREMDSNHQYRESANVGFEPHVP